jgi:hypothetical protein
MDYRFKLEDYDGQKQNRYTCPSCGRKKQFTLYVDTTTGKPLASDVGRCNRLDECGYHKTPRDYFNEHPKEYRPISFVKNFDEATPSAERNPDFIPFDLVLKSEGRANTLTSFLMRLFPVVDVERVAKSYHLGSTKRGEVIFPQIDGLGRCHTGKVMLYDTNGHRVRGERDCVDWLHARYKKKEHKESFRLAQCLFGEHLLSLRPSACVGLVESEKTAVICALDIPDFVWVATGGCQGLTEKMCKGLKGRNVMVYPDADKVREWTEKARSLTMCKNVRVSTWAKDEPPESKRDIADEIVRRKQTEQKPTTIGDVCKWINELGIPKGRITFNV